MRVKTTEMLIKLQIWWTIFRPWNFYNKLTYIALCVFAMAAFYFLVDFVFLVMIPFAILFYFILFVVLEPDGLDELDARRERRKKLRAMLPQPSLSTNPTRSKPRS